jgi:RNA polymerase sigma factor (sigma-70 family)
MPEPQLSPVVRELRKLAGDAPETDRDLLERFIANRDNEAFAALLARHAPLVWGVCRRLLRDNHAAEDAFQATFLVLSRKASSVRQPEGIAAWLYRVAQRLARAARKSRPVPLDSCGDVPAPALTDPAREVAGREVQGVLDEEIARLPESYRLPILLCFFEGRTHAEAAQELGWPIGTVAGRLARAKEMLHARLSRRGLGIDLATLVLPAVPPALVDATLAPALAFAAGLPGSAATPALALAQGWLRGQVVKRLAVGVALLLLATSSLALALAWPSSPPQAGLIVPGLPAAPVPKDPPAFQPVVNRIVHALRRECGIRCLAISPDGKTLATCGDAPDPSLRLWDVRTGKELAHFDNLGAGRLAFSPDGARLALANGPEQDVKVVDVKNGREIASFAIPRGQLSYVTVLALSFSPDGRTLIGGCENGTVFLWEARADAQPVFLTDFKVPVFSVALSPDGKTLVAGGSAAETTVKLWDVPTRKLRATFKGADIDSYREPDKSVFALAFRADGRTLLSADRVRVRAWDLQTGQEKSVLASPGSGGAFSPDGNWLVASSVVWNLKTAKVHLVLKSHRREIHHRAFSPDSSTLFTAGPEGVVKVWDVADAQELGALRLQREGGDYTTDPVTSLALSRDGKALISAGGEKPVRVWDLQRCQQRTTFPAQTEPVASVAISPDGKTVAVASGDRTFFGNGSGDRAVRLWDPRTGEARGVLQGHTSEVYCVCFSPAGDLLASASNDGTIRLWEVATGKTRATLKGEHSGVYLGMAFSPDGSMLVSGGQTVRLWDVRTGKEIAELKGHFNTVQSVCFSPDGSLIASGAEDGWVKLWDVKSRKDVATLEAHTWSVRAVCFTPDGKTLIAGHGSGADTAYPLIHLWDVQSRKLKATLRGHVGAVNALAISPDGATLFSGGTDRAILLWDLSGVR